jgi:catechol 2,3-dioxygenase-like lactoylglutathione lyase family enzyme
VLASQPVVRKTDRVSKRGREKMLGESGVVATIPVKDLGTASAFYEGTLGLKRTGEDYPDGILFSSGRTGVYIYESAYGGTNQATTASWGVGGDLDRVVEGLKERGVTFEQYDLPGVTREGDVHVMGDVRGVWFRDPDGNILSIMDRVLPVD